MSKIPTVPMKPHRASCDCFCCQMRDCVERLIRMHKDREDDCHIIWDKLGRLERGEYSLSRKELEGKSCKTCNLYGKPEKAICDRCGTGSYSKWQSKSQEPNDPEKVRPFECSNCGNGERVSCPLPLSECSGENDFGKWVRPLTRAPESKYCCALMKGLVEGEYIQKDDVGKSLITVFSPKGTRTISLPRCMRCGEKLK